MFPEENSQKPRPVLYAEYALWIWTAWACLFGIVQSWLQMPDIEKMITEQSQGIIVLEPQALKEMIIGGYISLAGLSAWVVWKIGAGKNWARSSLLWGFVLEVIWTAVPPYHSFAEYLTDIPDITLQSYALYLLYTKPGSGWFHRVGALIN